MSEKITVSQPSFSNEVIDKSQLKKLIVWAFRNYGIARAANMADKLKDLGFYYATKAGISLSLEDLKIPPAKKELLETTMKTIAETDRQYQRGEITAVERFQKVIDTWNHASESLKKEVVQYFRTTDPLNSIYMMAFSGARGNISQVRQLVGMRGLMSDPQGQIIDLPISSNFREGLTVTDYFISSYGARKGLVDIALRTADSGYLTRRLVDVSQDVIIREVDCKTNRGIILEDMVDNQRLLIPLIHSLLGRILAEDIYDPTINIIIAKANQEIGPSLAHRIVKAKISKVLVRSPITCNSIGSVCQLCYGWNLAHGRIVDLGEAVGIIAAQSIGEPGTQLTMRTFHTGGVFTGELAQKIYAPITGLLHYPPKDYLRITRTPHGDDAMLVELDCKVLLKSEEGESISINLNQGTLLLAQNNKKIEKNQVIAEYALSNRLATERVQKSILADFSGKIQFTDLTVEEIQNKQNTIRIAQTSGLIWILSGKTYRIPDNAKLIVNKNDVISLGTTLAKTEVFNQNGGQVRLSNHKLKNSSLVNQEIKIITASRLLSYATVYFDHTISNGSYILETSNNDKFLLKINPDQILINNQIIAELISDTYITKTGGIVKYLDLPVSKKKNNDLQESYDILGAGYILWISEETHEINKDISLLLVNNGDFVEAGTEIIKNIFTQNSGIIEVVQKDGIVREVIIKPGEIYVIQDSLTQINPIISKRRGFLRPGETIIGNLTTNKLVYWEYIQTKRRNYILIRPVIVYSIPNKPYHLYNSDYDDNPIELKVVKRTLFKDGERVKSIHGINLIQTYLVLNINKNIEPLNCHVEFKERLSNIYILDLIIAETLLLKIGKLYDDGHVSSFTKLSVENNQIISARTILAETNYLSTTQGVIEEIDSDNLYNRRLLVLMDLDKKILKIPHNKKFKVKLDDWICAGDEISDNVFSLDSGKIIAINKIEIILRLGRPYLVSNGAILNVNHGSLVQRGETLATLIFERAKTGDIVQGLPRIEEILEARKKSDSNFNPHIFLESTFRSYINLGLDLYDATILSVQAIQLFLVQEVQLVYQSQGVDIADKHVEVIVRQMTSKIKIEIGGSTDYLPGEIVELQKIHSVNKTMIILKKTPAIYYPILLGITKASLNTDSFISAASFQETTKVLTEAAISGKLDWLKGLKENVIIGRLIPAGTGFNAYNKHTQNYLKDDTRVEKKNILNEEHNNFIDDIILDDRSARKYHASE
uniref:DNA-directed RNA polymerase n=1 Tax=Lympha mucosa TaxID=2045360 RepID=A0A6B9VRW6_9FLOR|nr:RNA polymerase b''-subunit [Lympha mucosa]